MRPAWRTATSRRTTPRPPPPTRRTATTSWCRWPSGGLFGCCCWLLTSGGREARAAPGPRASPAAHAPLQHACAPASRTTCRDALEVARLIPQLPLTLYLHLCSHRCPRVPAGMPWRSPSSSPQKTSPTTGSSCGPAAWCGLRRLQGLGAVQVAGATAGRRRGQGFGRRAASAAAVRPGFGAAGHREQLRAGGRVRLAGDRGRGA